MKVNLLGLFLVFGLLSCQGNKAPLPFLNIAAVSTNGADTVLKECAPFEFVNQNNQIVSNETLKGKVYIADFFFVSCPTICPVMAKNLKKIYERYKDNDKFLILSHSIDTRHDSVPVLKQYEQRLGVDAKTWHFVTGKKDDIYSIGYDFYMATVQEDDSPGSGGYLHSGGLILVDKKGNIRGVYDGTDDAQVGKLMSDLKLLL